MNATNTVAAVLGTGVIGGSWAALFLAAGHAVRAYDPGDLDGDQLRQAIDTAWPTLESLGLTDNGDRDNYVVCQSAAEAVTGASFIQESVPERIEIKHALYAEIEPALAGEAIVASSASGLLVKEMQTGWDNPSRFILGHPFNPPHLIPLVELLGNEQTAEGVLEQAEDFYQGVGKITIRVNKEVPAHVANRLQAALWREALSLVENGVASVEDVDKAIWAGPGLRWAAMGPHMLFHLGAGAGGMEEFCNRYKDSFHRWWDDLDEVSLTPDLVNRLREGLAEEGGQQTTRELSALRDELIVSFLKGRYGIEKARSES